MSEMIDRIAKAILDAMDITDGLDGTAADTYARAAIAAMREPTEAMINASERAVLHPKTGQWRVDEIYQAMIDEAIK